MIERLNYVSINGPAIASMAKTKNAMPSINEKLRAIVELRVSQINGCAYCVDLHTIQARTAGETQQRLDCLTVWKEGSLFDEQEKAAMAWAETVTLIPERGAPHQLFEAITTHFSDEQVVDLTLVIAQLNTWDRMATSFGHVPDVRVE
jgi:AhpD family alkylhydroperoxidase